MVNKTSDTPYPEGKTREDLEALGWRQKMGGCLDPNNTFYHGFPLPDYSPAQTSIRNWLRRKLKCNHIHLDQTFLGYHTGDDRHTNDDIGSVFVRRGGRCPDCKGYIFTSVRLPNNLRDFFWANYKHCMADDPAVIANKRKDDE